jgi:outer membrane protein OmpA-like peptidoglycan-associated protein
MKIIVCLLLIIGLAGCSAKAPDPGPDQQGRGMLSGAALGAGSGAVIGAQVTAGAGPGAAVGAGLGAVFGAIQGATGDLLEDEEIAQLKEVQRLKIQLWVQEVMAEQYERRLRLHPGRDIYPAELFFAGDSKKLSCRSKLLSQEIGKRIAASVPWSRIVISSYITSIDESSSYAKKISDERAQEIALQLIKSGVEPRRIQTRGVVLTKPLLDDGENAPFRQAIEFLPVDY